MKVLNDAMASLLEKRIGVISKIAESKHGVGKTAMMKFIFLLQQVYKMPLGYDFEIYTYGPYASEVMSDINLAENRDYLDIKEQNYHNGIYGYSINPTKKTHQAISALDINFLEQYEPAIEEIITLFGDKTAKELELLTTIVYMYSLYQSNKWKISMAEIANNVHQIKPHFSLAEITTEYKDLKKIKIFDRIN